MPAMGNRDGEKTGHFLICDQDKNKNSKDCAQAVHRSYETTIGKPNRERPTHGSGGPQNDSESQNKRPI